VSRIATVGHSTREPGEPEARTAIMCARLTYPPLQATLPV
jgi:hypothetical protein